MRPRVYTPATISLACEYCGRSFTVFQSDAWKRRYCKRACTKAAAEARFPDRFWSWVKIGEPDACWPWVGARDAPGYGRVYYQGKYPGTNRVAFFLTHDYWPKNALHSCDNPPCCNPAHIFDGTLADNVRDMIEKGRQHYLHGADNPHSKLIESQVVEIRARHATGEYTNKALAEEYGVDPSTISDIVHRKNWRHL